MKPLCFLFIFWCVNCSAQESSDSLKTNASAAASSKVQRRIARRPAPKPETVVQEPPFFIRPIVPITTYKKGDESISDLLRKHPYFNFFAPPRSEIMIKKKHTTKDAMFYLLVTVTLFFALIKLLFGKYVNDLLLVFFRVSLKQKQIREQLVQNPLPSLLLNIFFVITGGIYISFLLRYYNFTPGTSLWLLMVYCTLALGLVYIVKFLMLKTTGWIFNISEATDTYIFVVFLVNKLVGVFLLPVLVLLAFSSPSLAGLLFTTSLTLIALCFAYRYIISYEPVTKEIKVTQFHFFLYLCAFEVIPLLLIYKVLLAYLVGTT